MRVPVIVGLSSLVLCSCALLAGVYDQDYAWQRSSGKTDAKVASAQLMNCQLAHPGEQQGVDQCMRELGYYKDWSDIASLPSQPPQKPSTRQETTPMRSTAP
jgi:hypothetical protein